MKKNKWINNKTVLITGASSGIGKGIAEKLINEYNCVVIGIGRNEDSLKSLNKTYKDHFLPLKKDISIKKAWDEIYDYIIENNIQLDILINNAGALPNFNKFENLDIEDAEKYMQVNYLASVYSVSKLLPIIKKSDSPSIINISSSAALMPLPGISLYTASKAALKNFTESLSIELKGKVKVMLVCPGFTKTNIFRNQKNDTQSKLIGIINMPCEKMVNKIIKGIIKNKKRMVFGIDAKYMDFSYRHFPKLSIKFANFIMKKSKLKIFNDIYNFDKNKINKEN